MKNDFSHETMLDIFILETTKNIEIIENIIRISQISQDITQENIEKMLVTVNLIRDASEMMMYDHITDLVSLMGEVVYYIQRKGYEGSNLSLLLEMLTENTKFIKLELEKVKGAEFININIENIIEKLKEAFSSIKTEDDRIIISGKEKPLNSSNKYYIAPRRNGRIPMLKAYEAVIYFEDGCEMENIRSYAIIHNLRDISQDIIFFPEDIIENNNSVKIIREKGFRVYFRTEEDIDKLCNQILNTAFVCDLEAKRIDDYDFSRKLSEYGNDMSQIMGIEINETNNSPNKYSSLFEYDGLNDIIRVNSDELDKLTFIIDKLASLEYSVIKNKLHDIRRLNYHIEASSTYFKHLKEAKETVMNMRLVSMSCIFINMDEIVRDMAKKIHKEVDLVISDNDTMIDKSKVEKISLVVTQLVRFAVEYGIEYGDIRCLRNKPRTGQITIETENTQNHIRIVVKDDGNGINKEEFIQQAEKQELIIGTDDNLNSDLFDLFFLRQVYEKSKNDNVNHSEFNADLITDTIKLMGGSLKIDSIENMGTKITIKIPT